ncbi:hypothetical protein CHISP_2396 [Chitinispirillum alkaliphilum]|nr:hypothetical protein CHISP_2396 [Chitinispirillum alkaliphilum]
MFNDEHQRGTGNSVNRKRNSGRYNEKGNSFNSSYSYGNNYNSFNGQQQQNFAQPRRRSDRHKNGGNSNDKLVKQNDLIIKLLREIRDRLPPLENQDDATSEAESTQQAQSETEEQQESSNDKKEETAEESKGNQVSESEQEEINFNV